LLRLQLCRDRQFEIGIRLGNTERPERSDHRSLTRVLLGGRPRIRDSVDSHRDRVSRRAPMADLTATESSMGFTFRLRGLVSPQRRDVFEEMGCRPRNYIDRAKINLPAVIPFDTAGEGRNRPLTRVSFLNQTGAD
jgi:hypothetical protein